MSLDTLTFENAKFVFTTYSAKTRLLLSKNPYWTKQQNVFVTKDLGAANDYRKFSDERTEKIFQTTFQTFYPLPKIPELPGLDAHQVEGVRWVLTRKRSYLAHCPGAGKTAQAVLASALSQGLGQVLFVVPPHLTRNWEREFYKFTPWVGEYGEVATVPPTRLKHLMNWDSEYIICPDSMITKDWVHAELKTRLFRFIAVDEASRFKDPQSLRSLALYGGKNDATSYPSLFRRSRHVVFLDGSPMPNRPIELWAPLYALDPESIDCKNYDDFGYRYCGAKPNERGVWEYLYSSNEAELKAKIQKTFMQVVTESELSHPERLRSIVVMNEDVRTGEYREWEKKNLGQFKKYLKFWGANGGEETSQGEIARFRKQLGIEKVPWIARYVGDRLQEKNESILLFVWHREVALKIRAALGGLNPGLVIGGTDAFIREATFKSFQAGTTRLLIMNIAAGGRGLNLQRADRVIFGEFSWTNETNLQCEKRASRKGSKNQFVRCEYIVAPDSMDEVVLNSIFTKEKRVGRIIG